jgi:hypothetical protein
MRRLLAGLTAAAFIVALGAPAFAKEETVKGQIVDQTCYLKGKAANPGKDPIAGEDPQCAVECAKKGAPMALVTSEGKVYQITGDLAANMNAKIVPHVLHTVEISGDVTTKDGKTTINGTNLKMISK